MRNSLCVLVVTTLAAIPATSQSQLPKAIEWHIGSALEAKLATKAPWVQLLDRNTLTGDPGGKASTRTT